MAGPSPAGRSHGGARRGRRPGAVALGARSRRPPRATAGPAAGRRPHRRGHAHVLRGRGHHLAPRRRARHRVDRPAARHPAAVAAACRTRALLAGLVGETVGETVGVTVGEPGETAAGDGAAARMFLLVRRGPPAGGGLSAHGQAHRAPDARWPDADEPRADGHGADPRRGRPPGRLVRGRTGDGTATMTPSDRRAAIQRIAAALHAFDDDLLRQLDAVVAAPIDVPVPDDVGGGLSRRQAIGGGTALVVLALAAAKSLAMLRASSGTVGEDAAVGAALGDRAGIDDDGVDGVDGGEPLLELYRMLRAENLDAEARTALDALAPSLGNAVDTAKGLAGGLDRVAAGLAAAEGALAPLRDGAARAETVLAQLAAALARVAEAAPGPGDVPLLPGGLVDEAQAAAERIGGWLAEAAGALPFGVGDGLRARLEAVRQVIVLVPETLAAVDGALLGPLRAQWLPADGAPGIGIESGLFEPLHDGVLDNGLALVAAAAELAAWRAGTEAELAAMIARRADTLRRIEAAEGG